MRSSTCVAPDFVLTVTLDGGSLFAQATGQGRARLFAEAETEFFYKVVEAEISFEVDGEGLVSGLLLRQGGQVIAAKRLAVQP